jgi:hypothetical protein
MNMAADSSHHLSSPEQAWTIFVEFDYATMQLHPILDVRTNPSLMAISSAIVDDATYGKYVQDAAINSP